MAPVPSTPSPKEFGQALAQLRAERGVTLEDIVQRTKIARRVLEALEAGDFHALPERVFARMFLRQLLAVLKEPADEWLQAFDRAFDRFEHSSQAFPVVQLPPVRRPRMWPWLLACTLVAAGVAVLALLGRPRPGQSGATVPPTPEVILDQLLASATPSAPPTPPPATPTPAATVLVIRALSRPSWVEVEVAGLGRFQRLLPAGTSWEIEAEGRPVDVKVGDAGAVALAYLGQVQDALGRAGEVVRLHLDGAAGVP